MLEEGNLNMSPSLDNLTFGLFSLRVLRHLSSISTDNKDLNPAVFNPRSKPPAPVNRDTNPKLFFFNTLIPSANTKMNEDHLIYQ